jgi:hypothetical protein
MMADKPFQTLPPSLQHKLVHTADQYAAYKAFKDPNRPGDPLVLQHLQRLYGADKGMLEFFAKIDSQPQLVQLMKDIHQAHIETAATSYIGPANPNALKESPGDILMHGLQNMTSGMLGTFGQALGQYAYPNDPQKANALGDVFKNIGDIVDSLHDGKSKSDVQKQKLLEKELGKVSDAMVTKSLTEKVPDKKESKEPPHQQSDDHGPH